MRKEEGSKNQKKAKADKNTGNKKAIYDYKIEGKKDQASLNLFTPKPDGKTDGGHSKKQ